MPTRQAPRFSDTGLYEVLKEDGTCREGRDPGLSDADRLRMYRAMFGARLFDARMMNLQRQGRIGFYGTITGQEAATIASAFALEDRDWLFPALREAAAAVLRGYPLVKMVAQCVGNALDDCRGRQMPCHPSWAEKHHVSMSSCIATQAPQATGAALAAKIRRDDVVVMGYVGDGATSEPDFATAMNFAGVFQVPLVMVCQNNQWAISVPVARQSVSETIAVKARAFGVEGVRVDGNDALAVYAVAKRAVDKARAGGGPTFIEAVTYRLGGHSSSDDPTRYRSEEEVAAWRQRDPLARMRRHLEGRGLWSAAREAALESELSDEIARAVEEVEAAGPPPPESLIEDVYASVPWHLREQFKEI